MTTRGYIFMITSVCLGIVLGVVSLAALLHSSHNIPRRPADLSALAVWRPTPTEALSLRAHGDWVACWDEGAQDHCRVADAKGTTEYDGSFAALPDDGAVPNARLHPVVSETISPWMWSNHAGRLVPMIHLEDGTVLAPRGSGTDLLSYVERVKKFSPHIKPLPIYAQYYHPAGSKY